MVEDEIRDGRRIAELLASEIDGHGQTLLAIWKTGQQLRPNGTFTPSGTA